MKYVYTDNLMQIVLQSTEDEKRSIHTTIDRYIEEYQLLKTERGGPMAAFEYMKKIQAIIDEVYNTPDGKEISCKEGCPFCCRMEVHITDDEAMLLAVSAKRKKIQFNKKRLMKQSLFKQDDWNNKPFEERKCVFLDEKNSCNAYEYRPVNCRKLLVVTPIGYCDPGYKGQIQQYMDLEVKIIATAIKTCCKNGTLPNIFRDKLSNL